MRFILLCFQLLILVGSYAQTDAGLFAYFSFDGCSSSDETGNLVTNPGGNPECVCGAEGDAMEFDGINDFFDFSGDYQRLFLGDYSISFYFQPKSSIGNQDLLSLRVGCNIDSVFSISYSGTSREIVVELFQNINRNEIMTYPIDLNVCWQHVVLVKNQKVLTLYINGQRVLEEENSQIIGVTNQGTLSLNNTPCLGISQERFAGIIDELRIYDRALSLPEAVRLYRQPDNILNPDTTVIIGLGVNIRISESCAQSYQWNPSTGVGNTSDPNTILSPQVNTLYSLTFNLGSCSVTDSIQITVVDPATLDCNQVFLPRAFTPNGDGLNENYGISNPYVLDRLVTFEIFSSWGEMIFKSSDPYSQWNGDYKGQAVNPGVFVYKITYVCSGDEFTKTGSFSVLR